MSSGGGGVSLGMFSRPKSGKKPSKFMSKLKFAAKVGSCLTLVPFPGRSYHAFLGFMTRRSYVCVQYQSRPQLSPSPSPSPSNSPDGKFASTMTGMSKEAAEKTAKAKIAGEYLSSGVQHKIARPRIKLSQHSY